MNTEADKLAEAARNTLRNNGWLTDGEQCTLRELRDALAAYDSRRAQGEAVPDAWQVMEHGTSEQWVFVERDEAEDFIEHREVESEYTLRPLYATPQPTTSAERAQGDGGKVVGWRMVEGKRVFQAQYHSGGTFDLVRWPLREEDGFAAPSEQAAHPAGTRAVTEADEWRALGRLLGDMYFYQWKAAVTPASLRNDLRAVLESFVTHGAQGDADKGGLVRYETERYATTFFTRSSRLACIRQRGNQDGRDNAQFADRG